MMEYGRNKEVGLQPTSVVICIAVIVLLTTICEGQFVFKWDVGPWGECELAGCGTVGKQYRTVWCKLVTGQPVLDDNCEADYKPKVEKECEKPCLENFSTEKPNVYLGDTRTTSYVSEYPPNDRSGRSDSVENKGSAAADTKRSGVAQSFPISRATGDVEWVVDQWTSCKLLPGSTTCGRKSGIQYRNVTCERKDRIGTVSLSRCELQEPKPATNQTCELLCRQDCVVSMFSEWSSCDSACQMPNRTRTRDVVVPPRHRGSRCPELSEMLVCHNCTQSYTYKLSDWLPCTTIGRYYLKDMNSHHIIGYQTREITCLQSNGVISSLNFCSDKFPHTVLSKHRTCIMSQDCQVSPWSAMQPYNISCAGDDGQVKLGYMIRTRQILQLPLGDGKPCPTVYTEYIQLNKDDISMLRPCKRVKWIMSSWSLCQPVPGYNHCGTGIRNRRAICIESGNDGIERPVDDMHCASPKPLLAQPCATDCVRDCSVSQWSEWSTCQGSQCERSDLRRRVLEKLMGKKFRTREVLTLPGPGGKACPHLSETRMCEPKPCYTWNVTIGPCEVTSRGGCGSGTQLQRAVCLNQKEEKVTERFCHESLNSEKNWVNCYIPCPEDCVLSEWGQWSICPDSCAGQTGTRSRHRHILAYHSPGRRNQQCPTTDSLLEVEPCPAFSDCLTYQWITSTWGQCKLNTDNPSVLCGPGTQSRSAECCTMDGIKSSDKCVDSLMPTTTQSCVIDCPVDCHVTQWSEWTECGISCVPLQARQILPVQIRQRFILQYPQNGGLTCPSDLREEQTCSSLPMCKHFFWNTTDWSDCILPPVVPRCGEGLRARNITCYQTDEKGSNQVPLITCLEKLGTMPEMTETCHVSCESECLFTPWSQWTLCGPRCEKTRFRFRRLMDESKNNLRCHNTELYPRDEHQRCICDNPQSALTGSWSDCIIQADQGAESMFASMSLKSISARHRRTNETRERGLGPATYCGAGKRYMPYSCPNVNQNIFNTPACTGREYQEENCSIPCPVDCKITSWSAWSGCSSECGTGIQWRERRIMTQPEYGGRRCPFISGQDKEEQTRVCTVDCNYNVWKAEDWNSCVPKGSKICGPGTQSRNVRCVSIRYDSSDTVGDRSLDSSDIVADRSLCRSEEEPPSMKLCSLPCPGECVMSSWSEWSTCTQPCNQKQVQSRTSDVLRLPASYAVSETCSPQKEERLCEESANCIDYTWEFFDWTSCLVNYGDADCGVGHKERFVVCRNANGEVVDSNKCEELFGPIIEPMIVSCEVPCDIDCLLSDWSDWSACTTTCGLGFTKRSRTILQNPIGNGRKCPEKLNQSKPCFQKSCYRWFVSDWSHCIVPLGVCGSGVQERNISCLNDEGKPVLSSICLVNAELLAMQTSRSCYMPCPGECKLSEWSSWSECFISCEDFIQGFRIGTQVRSRAILAYPSSGNLLCNETLWEDNLCSASECSQFTWVTTDWDMKTYSRQVYCTRSDGLQVTGGCDESNIPAHALTCNDPVCQLPALCVDVNKCRCPDGEALQVVSQSRYTVTCAMNATTPAYEGTSVVVIAKSPNIWMYAVITIGTLFVVAVTAALYNMCELFRTGPRPRRKEQHSLVASTTDTIHSVTAESEARIQKHGLQSQCAESLSEVRNHQHGSLYLETNISAAPSSDTDHNATPPMSHDLEDIPTIDAIVRTPTSPSLTATTTASATTVTTPTLPTDPRNKPSSPSLVMIQVGDVVPDRSISVSKLSHKRNRRYNRIYRLLPARISNCLLCYDNSSSCMLNEMHEDTHLNMHYHRSQDLHSPSEQISNKEGVITEQFRNNENSVFFQHNCMLSQPQDITRAFDSSRNRQISHANLLREHTGGFNIPFVDNKDCEIKSAMCEGGLETPKIKGKEFRNVTTGSQDNLCSAENGTFETLSQTGLKPQQQEKNNLASAFKLMATSKSIPQNIQQDNTQYPLLRSAQIDHLQAVSFPFRTKLGFNYAPTAHSSVPTTMPSFPDKPSDLYLHPIHSNKLSHSSGKPLPHIYENPRINTPMRTRSDLESFTKPPNQRSYMVTALTPPFDLGSSKSKNGYDGTTPAPFSKIPSSNSLPHNWIGHTKHATTTLPLTEKSRKIVPQSQSVRTDSPNIEFWPSGLSPVHDETADEPGHRSQRFNLCNNCKKKEISSAGANLMLLESPDSNSQASNISGMETSV